MRSELKHGANYSKDNDSSNDSDSIDDGDDDDDDDDDYDEKWFWGMVCQKDAKACEELGILDAQTMHAYHKSHIKKRRWALQLLLLLSKTILRMVGRQ